MEAWIDERLVRALLAEQQADLASLPLVACESGWDNQMYRLGDDLAVRLPRRAAAVPLVLVEQRWLTDLSKTLPLPVPAPVRQGRPGAGFPWPWSVVPWFAGETMSRTVVDAFDLGRDLGRFLEALHRPAPIDAPVNLLRGIPLSGRTRAFDEHLGRARHLVDESRVRAAWQRFVEAPPWTGVPLWIHGDVHPDNLLTRNGRLAAVIDFGDLTAGDPATDFAVAWMLPREARTSLREAARSEHDPIDDGTWQRARGWALAMGVAYLAHSRDDQALRSRGVATVEAVLDDDGQD